MIQYIIESTFQCVGTWHHTSVQTLKIREDPHLNQKWMTRNLSRRTSCGSHGKRENKGVVAVAGAGVTSKTYDMCHG